MTLRFKTFGIIAAAMMALPFFTSQAQAAGCIVEEKKTGTELEIKQAMLSNALFCAKQEISDIKESVKVTEIAGDRASSTKHALIGSLDQAIAFYDEKSANVSTLSMNDIQSVSKQVLEARASNYGPMMRQALAFVVWGRNQKLFKTAHERVDQVGKTVEKLKFLENENIDKLYHEAKSNLATADGANSKARDMVLDLKPAAESSPAIQLSISKLSETYKTLIALSDLVNSLVK